MSSAHYEVSIDAPHALVIRDLDDGQVSVTNDAAAVVAEVADALRGRALFYVDTLGRVDRIVVEGGRFAGFAPGWNDFDAAMAALIETRPKADNTGILAEDSRALNAQAAADDRAAKVDAFLRAIIGEDEKAFALCPFTWKAAREFEPKDPALPYWAEITAPQYPSNFWHRFAYAGHGATPLAAIRAAVESCEPLKARLVELEACP